MAKTELTVKTAQAAERIAKALSRINAKAAREYMDGFARRQHVEQQARSATRPWWAAPEKAS